MSGVRYPLTSSTRLTAITISLLAHRCARCYKHDYRWNACRILSFPNISSCHLVISVWQAPYLGEPVACYELTSCSYSENLERLYREVTRRQSFRLLERADGRHRLGVQLAVDLAAVAPRLAKGLLH